VALRRRTPVIQQGSQAVTQLHQILQSLVDVMELAGHHLANV